MLRVSKIVNFSRFIVLERYILVILDGWGVGKEEKSNAIFRAHTPNIDEYSRRYSYTELEASGSAVGLPSGQMGNSEVGHLHLGAGRVVMHELISVAHLLSSGTLRAPTHPFQAFLGSQKEHQSHQEDAALHLIGLLSTGGVHAHITHLKGLLSLCAKAGIRKVYVHVFLDGRDMSPCSALPLLEDIEHYFQEISLGRLATVMGRYYGMDRDNRWERTSQAYRALVHGEGEYTPKYAQKLTEWYGQNQSDEFISPLILYDKEREKSALVKEGDGVLFFNFRADRMRQLCASLCRACAFDLPASHKSSLPLKVATLTPYDERYKDVVVLSQKPILGQTWGEVIAQQGLQQWRIAETEKYAHVTYFFSGRREAPFEGETRILCPSPKVSTYDLAPKMSARAITDTLCTRLKEVGKKRGKQGLPCRILFALIMQTQIWWGIAEDYHPLFWLARRWIDA